MSPGDTATFDQPEFHDATIAEAVEQFVRQACEMGASDLFFLSNEKDVAIAVRHLGVVRPLARVGYREGQRYVNYVKVMAGIDLADRRRPGDGRWIFKRPNQSDVDLRANTIPTLFGADATLRILLRETGLRSPDGLGLLRSQYNELLGMLNSPSGLILVTGPTGAGKSATMYACLNVLNNGLRKINTIEDPIEYAVDGVRQSQVNLPIAVDFPDLLRNVLRQAPDVIMIGEIRDPITAQTAIRAANSGHLVFATLHAPVAGAAVQSMLALGVHPHFLSTCLRGILAQRLVRVLCPDCRMKIDVAEAPHTFDEVRPWLDEGQGNAIYGPQGCEKCQRTGYVDRTGVFEILPLTRKIRRLIGAEATGQEIEQHAISEGMLELRRAGLVKVAQGVTSAEELVRVIPAEHLGAEA